MAAKKKPKAPDLIAIANKLRSCALVLRSRGSVPGPIEVIEDIVEQIDRWEQEVADAG